MESASSLCTVLQEDFEFIQWWKEKQGSIAPFARFEAVERRFGVFPAKLLAEDEMPFLIEYINSAQYLEADHLLWGVLLQAIINGSQVTFPNLHAVVAPDVPDSEFYRLQIFAGYIPTGTLRRLSLSYGIFSSNHTIPLHWSNLTHLSFLQITLPLSTSYWISFLRSFPSLKWGCFNLIQSSTPYYVDEPIVKCKLTRLTSLFLKFDSKNNRLAIELAYTFSSLFVGLHLPTLHTLSLSSDIPCWRSRNALFQISSVLQSAPNIRFLALGGRFLSLGEPYCNTDFLTESDIEPIWSRAPSLARLQLEWSDHDVVGSADTDRAKIGLNLFLADAKLVPENKWLNLQNPICTIREITIVDEMIDVCKIAGYAKVRLQELSAPFSNVHFQIAAKSKHLEAQEEWEEWGAVSW
ncbi:hypothetical protein BDN70DRAFT_931782 [Pholiota conissans]|uniref:Uncharacterized protein n=1 Tax=Pholiota conissans TaxID=109636 RepID=A0A9P5Z3E3_9AGAR|nr:hypothetical protein BDN70DRAFT_931782 [Pholiota conissans]